MELIGKANTKIKKSLVSFNDAHEMFTFAREYVNEYRSENLNEIWKNVEDNSTKIITEHEFVKEHLWCAHVAGFSAKVIAQKFKPLLMAHKIEDEEGQYLPYVPTDSFDLAPVLAVFGNVHKANAVLKLRRMIHAYGWPEFHLIKVEHKDPRDLTGLPGIGDTLAYHLARNLGNVNVVKPDVHLMRLASKYNFRSPLELVKAVSKEPPGKVDLILWLASVDNGTL